MTKARSPRGSEQTGMPGELAVWPFEFEALDLFRISNFGFDFGFWAASVPESRQPI
jgi:hypothetical protein